MTTRYHGEVATTDTELMRTRLLQAFDLFEAGVSMRRASLRREHPDKGPNEIECLLREWLATRPGAEHGDTVGTLRALEPPG
jgi:hypothetical protein